MHHFEIKRKANETPIFASISYSKKDKDGKSQIPLALFLHGAGCASTKHIHLPSLKYFEGTPMGVLTVDKPGAHQGWAEMLSLIYCKKEFNLQNHPSERAASVIYALQKLRDLAPVWNGDLYVIGSHEGGIAASLVAQKVPVKGLVLVGIGEGFPGSEAFSELSKCMLSKSACESKEILGKLSEMENLAPHVPVKIKGISGTNNWWKEMLSLKTSEQLAQIDTPVLIVHGEKDPTVLANSAKMLHEKLDKNSPKSVDLKIYEGLDGNFMDENKRSQKHQVQLDITSWIKDLSLSMGPESLRKVNGEENL